ncbi:lytic transglycosylase domain-containing protein [Komagataeibacter oboediens]|uniref:lytic transglycosylase domain-containing protein n=1 Tax=Komagataeibacter oboediens TaxID=65958 RepID=UPI0019031B94|nr:lytic transglycosylase [Komagataeibacter oboediens]
MIRVKTLPGLLVVCAGFAIPMQTANAAPLETYVTEAATRMQIPSAWIAAVMQAESQGDASTVSPKGAMGLMQIMPDTWRELRHALNLGADPYDPHDNITAGAAYLRWLHDRYGDAGFLAAYNAGPGRYEQLLTAGKMLPDETRKYVARVVRLLHGRRFDDLASGTSFAARTPIEPSSASLFFVRPDTSKNPRPVLPLFAHVMQSNVPPSGLFIPISQRSAP